jgi:transcriptional/translational regulatory protein YebC/TACO1
MKPKNLVKITEKQKAVKVLNFMDKLQDHDDVQKVHANFDIPDEVLKLINQSTD